MKLPLKSKTTTTPITWDQFREAGMLFLVNSILHSYGLAICVEVEDGKVTGSHPARVPFRGFSEADQDEEHTKIAEYLKDNAIDFPDEIK